MALEAVISKTRSSLQNALCIVGPTSVGKSILATALARRLDGEIIGVDAFQLYRGLPILTGQPTTHPLSTLTSSESSIQVTVRINSLAEKRSQVNCLSLLRSPRQEIPQHLIGTLSPAEECDAMRYCSMALPLIDEIVNKQRFPLLVGGTGFYLRTLISPLDPLPAANVDLRAQFAVTSHEQLLAQLQKLDPEAASQIDIKNRRRLERVLEILLLSQKSLKEVWSKQGVTAPRVPGIFLTRDREDLHQRIESRVRLMFDQGVLEEVARLGTVSRTAAMTLGLREIQAYQRGEATLSATIQAIIKATKHYAKRQMTWFRNRHDFPELNLSRYSSLEATVEAVAEILKL